MGELNHHAINNGDITSDFPVEFNYESVLCPDNTLIQSIDDYGTCYLLEFFHSENDNNLLDIELQMLQS